MVKPVLELSLPRGRGTLMALACSAVIALAALEQASAQDRGVSCRPVGERAGEVGCWIIAHVPQGQVFQPAVFWHLDTYPTRTEAEAAKGSRGTVVESLGKVWLFTIGEAGWRAPGGVRVAEIGPLHVKSGEAYTARYMEAIFNPGMKSTVHRHPGPEAWYTTAGEVCLETPDGKTVGRAGESTIVPAGPPMELTATGSQQRRSLVLILHESSQPSGFPVSDWTPKGLCRD
jgi:quercetin dioxygenase-like cupin family protein